MDVLKFEDFDFTVKPNFEELEASGKLFKYLIIVDFRIGILKKLIGDHIFEYPSGYNLNIDKLTQYDFFSKYVSDIKKLKEKKEHLKILEERINEINEYLESLEILKKFI